MANTYTPGLALRQPAQGDDYWDDDLNANADILEATLGRKSGLAGVCSGLSVSADAGLEVSYAAGVCLVDGVRRSIGAGSKTCTDSALNFLYVDAAGAVQVATSLPSPSYCALALVETSGGAIVRIGDLRRRIFDALAEHNEAGSHAVIKPTRIEPTGTAGAYRRSSSNYREPESQVNNVILKKDATPLVAESNRGGSWSATYTAGLLGSGYVPADANGLIVSAKVWDTTAGQRSGWSMYPVGDSSSSREAVAISYLDGGAVSYHQLTFRLSSEGQFKLALLNASQSTANITLYLVGWIEPA